jgi:hypothetical protein
MPGKGVFHVKEQLRGSAVKLGASRGLVVGITAPEAVAKEWLRGKGFIK